MSSKDVEALEGKDNRVIDFDRVLKYIGSCGRYQIFLVLMAYYACLPIGMHQVAAVFLAAVPMHRCWIPEIDSSLDKNDYFSDDVLNATTPEDEANGCSRYIQVIANCTISPLTCLNNTNAAPTAACDSYVYDDSVYKSTVSTEWDLVCDRLIVGTSVTSVYYAGCLVSAVVGGNIADMFGRAPTMFIGQMGMLIVGIGCAFAPTLFAFAAIRFTLASFLMASYVSAFVYVMEITAEKWRTVVGINMQAAFALGYMLLSGLAYNWRDWRQLQLAISLVSLPFAGLWLLMPESPRWLFSKRRNEKAKLISSTMARRNGKTLPENVWKIASIKESHDHEEKYSPVVLFRRPRMRLLTLNVMFIWFVVALVYYGLSLNVGNLAGSPYLNNTLSGIVELLCFPFVIVLMDKVGRRMTMCSTLIFGGVSCLGSTLAKNYSDVNPDFGTVGTVLALCGKFAVSGTFAVIYNYTAELYPTVVRSTAVGLGSMSARVGSMLTPYTLYLQYSTPWLTGTIFGVLSLVAGGLSLLFPETMGAPMLTTLDEAETFYAHRKYTAVLTNDGLSDDEEIDTVADDSENKDKIDVTTVL